MISLPKKTKTPSGAFGKYFKISRSRGLKILKGSFRSLAAAYNSHTFDEAKEEAELLKFAEDTGITPRSYGVRVVRSGSRFRVGILMEHLGNKTLADMKLNDDEQCDVVDKLHIELESAGISHGDLHARNIMYYRGTYYVIDFSPWCTEILDNN